MKKIYFLAGALAIASSSFAQTISNAGFETWRTGTAGTSPTVNIQAPDAWIGADSLAIGGLETYGALLFGRPLTDLHAQVFQETTKIHGGNSSAKLITVKQDTAGMIPGSLANAQPGVNVAAISGGIANALTYSGGTPTTLRITSVSAWVEYYPGKDSVTHVFGGVDSGMIVVNALATIGGVSTVVGTGRVMTTTATSFTQITANVTYTDTVHVVDTVQIIFSSSKPTGALDSSIMYVDDVSMVGVAQVNSVPMENIKANVVNVYPNPATGIIHLDGPQNAAFNCELYSVSGQVVATKAFAGNDALDISGLPGGIYFYIISDANGNKIQRGKVTVNR